MSEQRASLFSPALVIGLVAAGIISFAAFLALLAWGGEGAARGGGRATAVSSSAIGFRGLYQLVGRYEQVQLARSDRDLGRRDLLVVALEPGTNSADVQALLRRRSGLPTLLILPKWEVVPDPERRSWVRSIGPGQTGEAGRIMGRGFSVERLSVRGGAAPPVATEDLLKGLRFRLPRAAQVIHGDRAYQLAGVPGEGPLVAQLDDQPHYVVADPDLLNNQGLADRGSAESAVRMLRRMMPGEGGTILFDLTMNGVGGGRSLLRTMLEPPFLAMTLALLAAALMAAWHGAGRFGPVRRPVRAIPFGKAALVENSAALLRVAGREVRLGGAYADVVRDEAARAGAAPPGLHGPALDAYLDRFGKGGAAPSFTDLAAKVRTATGRAELVAAARALFQWKKDMIR